jgi:FMN phosphatase YigB (HAD superfamily)
MTKGILMFAINGDAKDPKFNTVHIDYIAMATANAKNIKTHMQNNNVALITNMEGKSLLQEKGYIQYFDHVVIIDADGQGVGPNTNPQVNTRGKSHANRH